MLPFAENYKHDKRFAKSNWLCRCGYSEDENHLTSGLCPIYGDLVSKDLDFSLDEYLVLLFTDILERRDELEKSDSAKKTHIWVEKMNQIRKQITWFSFDYQDIIVLLVTKVTGIS